MVKGAGKNPVLAIMQGLSNGKEGKKKAIGDYEMKAMAYEGCGARMLQAIEEKKARSLAYAVKDLIKLCNDEYEEDEDI